MRCEFVNYNLIGGVKATGIDETDRVVCWVRKGLMHLKYNLTYKTLFTDNFSAIYVCKWVTQSLYKYWDSMFQWSQTAAHNENKNNIGTLF